MPELPDIQLYTNALNRFTSGYRIEGITVRSPFLVRSVTPTVMSAKGKTVVGTWNMGKRIVLELEQEIFLVFHLMIAGRFKWSEKRVVPKSRNDLLSLDFSHGTLIMTESGTKKRASLYVVSGKEEVRLHDPDGIDVLNCDWNAFDARLRKENHTVKRALTDPGVFSGIGNAYSDEILHEAGLSPFTWTNRMSDEDSKTLRFWITVLEEETGSGFPKKVTAFREAMAVHGKFGKPCPKCGAPIQRIVYGARETNYCPGCQTSGTILADRALSRILKDDWPKNLDELENMP